MSDDAALRGRWKASVFYGRRAMELGTIAVVLTMAAILVSAPLNTDAAFCVIVARRLLGGERLYVNIMETNPPLIFWIYKLPTYANSLFGLHDDHLVGAFVACLLFGSCALSAAVLRFASRLTEPIRFGVLATFAVAVVVPFVQQVGQKEQIAVMLFFPYALVAAREIDGDRVPSVVAWTAAAAAAIGIAIKPFFLAPWIALEAAVAVATGRWNRRSAWLVLGFQVCYGLGAVVGNDAYRSHVFPMVRALYWAYGTSWTTVATAKAVLLLGLAAGAACACYILFPRTAGSADALVAGTVSIGWLIAVVAQSKGWFYHLLPALVFGTLAVELTGFVLLSQLQAAARRPRQHRLLPISIVAAVVLVPLAWLAPVAVFAVRILDSTLQNPYGEGFAALTAFVAERATGEPIYVMSTSMWPLFPMVNVAGATMPYRFHFLWPLPALYARGYRSMTNGRDPEQQDPLERAFFETVVNDLVENPPRILIVDRNPYQQAMDGVAFDHIAYFSHAPRFRALMRRYTRDGSMGQYDLFELR